MFADEEDFAAALAAFEEDRPENQHPDPQVGEKIRGTILALGEDVAFVDLGGKAEGILPLGEIRDADGGLLHGVGDPVEAMVSAIDPSGCFVLRLRPGSGETMLEELRDAAAHGLPVEGRVTGINKGGAEVEVATLSAFCPLSQLDLRYVEDPAIFIGQRFQFRITRFEEAVRGSRPNIVLSRRLLLEEEAKRRAAETRARLEVGAVVRGRVTAVTSYGAFVDLGGLEGLLHVSEMGHGRIADPQEVVGVGQELEVQVTRIEPEPRGNGERISLSIRSLERDPWLGIEQRFPAGATCEGRITRLMTYGAFVELEPGVEGLVHLSELGAEGSIRHPREVVHSGQQVAVRVLRVDPEKHRLSLSIAAPRAEAEAAVHAAAQADFARQQNAAEGGFGSMADFFAQAERKRRK